MKLMKTKAELLDYLHGIEYGKMDYHIAVEALIFTQEGKLLLEKRGYACRDEVGKLEGVGGSLDENDDFIKKLQEEFDQELAAQLGGLEIKIERMLEIRSIVFEERKIGRQPWIVVSYLCRLEKGKPLIGEPDKIESLHELTLEELYSIDDVELSGSMVCARKTYFTRYGFRPYFEVSQEEELSIPNLAVL